MKIDKQQPSQMSTADRPSTFNQPPTQIEDAFYSELHFGFEVPTNFIIDLFQEVSEAQNFQMIEKEANHATAIKQIKKSLLQMLDCFNWVSEGNMTAVKLTIQTNQKTSKRICKIRGLVGSKREVKLLIKSFQQKSQQLIKIHNNFYPEQLEDDNSENLQNPFHLQACAIYMFHKILSNDQYGIGVILKNSLSNYKNKYGNVEASSKLLPQPMKNLIKIIQQIIDNLYKDFNYGKKEMQKVMPYCRVSVQKYIFNQVESILVPMYHLASSQADNIFQEKRTKIFNTKTLAQIFDDIGLVKDLWFIESKCDINAIKTLAEWRAQVKYIKGCQQLQKITRSKTPRQKMKHCQITYTLLKTLFYEETNRKRELTNIEQIIPVFITVILFSQVNSLKGELQMVKDFVELDPCDMESEKRLLLNLTESFNFIYRDWKV